MEKDFFLRKLNFGYIKMIFFLLKKYVGEYLIIFKKMLLYLTQNNDEVIRNYCSTTSLVRILILFAINSLKDNQNFRQLIIFL